jgi:hypothetical protein
MIHILKMRENNPHLFLIATNLTDSFLHEPAVRREAFGAFLRDVFSVPPELVAPDTRHDEADHVESEQLFDDAEDGHLLRVLCKVKRYARVDQHPKHQGHSKLLEVHGWGTMIATGRRGSTAVMERRGIVVWCIPC